MKHIKSFQQLNEGLESNNFKKEFDDQLKLVDEISKGILNAKDLKDKLKAIQKDKPDVAKALKGYFDLAAKAQKVVRSVKSKGISKHGKKAEKQVKALTEFAATLKKGFDYLKTFNKKTTDKTNEGLGNLIGNTLRNLITGKWILNLLSSVKTNLMDSENEIRTVQDVFDIKDY